jgi:hypothetical protein
MRSGRVGLMHNNPILGAGQGNAGQGGSGVGRDKLPRPHRGGAGSGISSTCAGRVRVTHDPVPIRPVAIPKYYCQILH